MTVRSSDTVPEAEKLQIERLQQMPPWRKLELMAEMGEVVRALSLAGLRQRHPNDSPDQRKRRLADLMLGPELAAKVYVPFEET